MSDWFESWFDSKYYHLLYAHRNEEEAKLFITKLVLHLNLPKGSAVLDLACGKGRHAMVLASAGLKVTGADLSPASIACANQASEGKAEFIVHDMRQPIEEKKFQAVFNLFTSLGYFEDAGDNLSVINSVWQMLDENGLFIIDFFNAQKVVQGMVQGETVVRGDIHFNITRQVINGKIVKTIQFIADTEHYSFNESVSLFDLEAFTNMLNRSGFKIESVFGDYNLGTFAPEKSDRLILVARKTNQA
ncbi:MAG: class I SAM-dependent methyltransferase [Crocinitomicaceae bacterium]|nr:class I SAM-dependent methyltransferase [Crocinitomicaceae bacterium]MBK8925509.1 class I SAM-dependent methyltransferase [Crocinitomicaceae bacterium]